MSDPNLKAMTQAELFKYLEEDFMPRLLPKLANVQNIEAENARLKAEVEEVVDDNIRLTQDNGGLKGERDRLQAEVERLTQNTDKLCKHGDLEIERLQAEVERLRKAGDAMYESKIGYYGEQILEDMKHHSGELCRNWNAAKDGKQP